MKYRYLIFILIIVIAIFFFSDFGKDARSIVLSGTESAHKVYSDIEDKIEEAYSSHFSQSEKIKDMTEKQIGRAHV